MTQETIGEAFMRPFQQGIRSGQAEQRIIQKGQLSSDRLAQQDRLSNARMQNQWAIGQMRMMIMQQQLAQMKQSQQIDLARLKQSQDELAEKKNEFDLNRQDKLTGVDSPSGKGSALLQTQNDLMSIVKKFDAYDPKTGNVDKSKIPAMWRQRLNQDLLYIQQHGSNPLAMKRILQFSNVKSTIDGVDLAPLKHYSGALGKARLYKDKKLSGLGAAPDVYNKYQTLVETKIPLAAEQVGQAFGGSVQQYATDVRNSAIANNNWTNNPELIESKWKAFTDLVDAEHKNALADATNPDFAFGDSADVGTNAFKESGEDASGKGSSPVKKIVKLKMVDGELQ